MKLLPLVGFRGLRFGDQLSKVLSIAGEPIERRSHPYPEQRTSLSYTFFSVGFDEDERLNFIAVDEHEVELWGDRPFAVARRSADAYDNVKQWIGHLGYTIRPSADCFGATLSVPEQGVTFCFDLPDCIKLEGIQLYPE